MNKPLTVTVPHALGAAEARRRLDTGFPEWRRAGFPTDAATAERSA